MGARILITGIKGVVGSRISAILRERGHYVYGIGRSHASDPEYARCDLGEYRQLERVFRKAGPFEYVYNCAAEFGRWNGEDYFEQLWRTNCIGTKNVIRLQEQLGFKLIHFSSSEVYGDYDGVMSEDVMERVAIRQLNDYAMTKWVNEQQIVNSALQYETKSVRVRLFNTYGPGEWYSPYRSVNCRFCYSALMGLPVTVYRGHFRTSTYLDDTATTLANIVDSFHPGEVYNIGGTEYHSIEELAEAIWSYTGADRALISFADGEAMTTKVKKVDISKSTRDLKHQNTVRLSEGVGRTIEWMREFYRL